MVLFLCVSSNAQVATVSETVTEAQNKQAFMSPRQRAPQEFWPVVGYNIESYLAEHPEVKMTEQNKIQIFINYCEAYSNLYQKKIFQKYKINEMKSYFLQACNVVKTSGIDSQLEKRIEYTHDIKLLSLKWSPLFKNAQLYGEFKSTYRLSLFSLLGASPHLIVWLEYFLLTICVTCLVFIFTNSKK